MMAWAVLLTGNVRKNLKRLPKGITEIFQLLLAEIKLSGPGGRIMVSSGRTAIIVTFREAGPLMWRFGRF